MPQFVYEALTPTGSVDRGSVTVETEAELDTLLRERGHYLIKAEVVTSGATLGDEAEAPARSAKAAKAAKAPRVKTAKRGGGSGVSRKDVIAFTEYLAGTAQAGIPLLSALHDLEVKLDSARMRGVVKDIIRAVAEEGRSLSDALSDHPKVFTSLYVSTIAAGEMTGKLDYVLQQLVAHLDWQAKIATQIRQATMYPLIVLIIMIILVVALVMFVYPRLLPIFEGFNVELPLPTRIIIGIDAFIRGNFKLILAGIAGGTGALYVANRNESTRYVLDGLRLRMPIMGELRRQLEMSRFVTYTALFFRAGIDLIRGLELIERMTTNRVVAAAIRKAREDIVGGSSITDALSQSDIFPQVVIRSFSLGESTGRLEESLGRAEAYYNREVPAAVERMLAGLQPLLVMVMGGLVTLISLSIFLPILSIYQSIG